MREYADVCAYEGTIAGGSAERHLDVVALLTALHVFGISPPAVATLFTEVGQSPTRSEVLLLHARGELPSLELHLTGMPTITKMVEKAWIERVAPDAYRITSVDKAALGAKVTRDPRRWKAGLPPA